MPATPWDEIRGYNCVKCGGPAMHFYGNAPICCECHAGPGSGLISREEAERENPEPRIRNAKPMRYPGAPEKTPVKSIGSIGSLWAILRVEQPIPGIGVRLAPLSPVFRHPACSWPSQGDTISLLSASDAARDCARRP